MRFAIMCLLVALSASPVWAADKMDVKKDKASVKTTKKTTKDNAQAAIDPTKPTIFACPDSITVQEQKIAGKNIPEGFSAFTENVTYWLETVSVYSGEKPERVEPVKSTENSSLWVLEDKGDDYFLGCSYYHTSVMLRKKIPDNFKTCHVLPKFNPSNPHGPQVLQLFTCEP